MTDTGQAVSDNGRRGVEVVVEHVRKGFESGLISSLEDVSLRIEPGEFVSLIGPSGSGKSTLLNLIGALDRPDAGYIAVGGHRLLPRKEREQRARELLIEVDLEHRLNAYPGTLSGGERQRVAIARALANRPCLLLADEPTGSLDSASGERIMALLKGLRDQHQMTVLVVTNDLATAAAGDRTLRMRDGRVEEVDGSITPAVAPRSE